MRFISQRSFTGSSGLCLSVGLTLLLGKTSSAITLNIDDDGAYTLAVDNIVTNETLPTQIRYEVRLLRQRTACSTGIMVMILAEYLAISSLRTTGGKLEP